MSNLDYIDEIGAGEPSDNDTEVETNTQSEESQEDFVQEPEDDTSDNTEADTESNGEIEALRKQIEGMEKRIADKDEYINTLREVSKQKEADNQSDEVTQSDEDEDFWSNPEETIKSLKDELKQQREATRIQQLQTQEIHYANTVDNYWKTVNPTALKEAVSMDEAFAKEFNDSKEPYKTAYEYLSQKNQDKATTEQAYKDRIIQDYLKENGIVAKEKKEVPPNINGGGKSQASPNKATSDGFAAVFGGQ